MREILFRGKDIAENWHYGVPLVFIEDYICMTAPHTYNKTVIPSTVGQYTGLTDKNGKKIFEGDIVEDFIPFNLGMFKTNKYLVEYSDSLCGFKPFCESDHYGYPIIEECKIIGNIHDNPELLKGGE